jgi:hypothetical protein
MIDARSEADQQGVSLATVYRRRKANREGSLVRRQLPRLTGSLRTARTSKLLRMLGVPKSEIGKGNEDFWRQNNMWAEHIAKLARDAYRTSMQSLHPDRNGNARDAAVLNEAMGWLRKRFRRRGIRI